MIPGSQNIAILTKIYYKTMTSIFNTKALKQSPKGETILLQFDPSNSRSFVPKRIKWEEVTLPESWIIPNVIPPKSIENSKVEYIEKILKEMLKNLLLEKKNIQLPRSSCSSIKQKIFNPSRNFSQNSRLTRSKSYVNLRSLNHTSRVPEMFYENENKSKKNSQTFSPSYSQMAGTTKANSEIFVIIRKEDFQINKIMLREDFYSNLNTEKKNLFF